MTATVGRWLRGCGAARALSVAPVNLWTIIYVLTSNLRIYKVDYSLSFFVLSSHLKVKMSMFSKKNHALKTLQSTSVGEIYGTLLS